MRTRIKRYEQVIIYCSPEEKQEALKLYPEHSFVRMFPVSAIGDDVKTICIVLEKELKNETIR